MTAEEMKADGAPLEGVDITPKQDEGVLKVPGGYSPSPPSALARRGPCGGGKSGGFPLGLRAGAPQAPWPHRAHCVPRGEGNEAVPGHPGRAGAARAIKQQRRAGARPGCASAARPPAGAPRSSRLPPPRPGPARARAARRQSPGSRGGGAVQGKGASRCVRAFPRGLGEDAGGAGELGSLSGPQLGLWGSESIPAPPARVWGWELKMEPRQGTCARCPSPPCPAVPPLRPRAPGSPRARGARSGGRSGLAAPRCPGRAGRSAARPRRSGCSPLYWEGRR